MINDNTSGEFERVNLDGILNELVAAVDAAKAKSLPQRWLNAIDSGYDWLLQQDTIRYNPETHALFFPSESGRVYFANGTCQCEAFVKGQPCRHRAASRLVALAEDAIRYSER